MMKRLKRRAASWLAMVLVMSLIGGNLVVGAAPSETSSDAFREETENSVETEAESTKSGAEAGASEEEKRPDEEGDVTEESQTVEDTTEEKETEEKTTEEKTTEESFTEDTKEESMEETEESGETDESEGESSGEETGSEDTKETDPESSKERETESSGEETESESSEEVSEELIGQYFAEENPAEWLFYNTYIQGEGWQGADAKAGATSGRENSGKNIEALRIGLKQDLYPASGIRYRVHMQTYGWLDYTSGDSSGNIGSGKRTEAVQMTLSGSIASVYDIYYRTYVQDYGWLGWAKNGDQAGSMSCSKRLEAIQIVLVKKGGAAPGSTERPLVIPQGGATPSYPNTHVNTGNNKEDILAIAKTQVGYQIDSEGKTKYGSWYGNYINGDESFYASAAWCAMFVSWCADQAGISTDNFRFHSYTPTMRSWYLNRGRWFERDDTSYTPQRGDLIFFKYAGGNDNIVNHVGLVTGVSKDYVETIEGNTSDSVKERRYARSDSHIIGYAVPGYNKIGGSGNFGDSDATGKLIGYTAYVEGKGWDSIRYDEEQSGSVGSSKRMQALKVQLTNPVASGSVTYRVHMQTYGWQDWVKDGAVAGITNELKRMEAVQIKLTGEMANRYDIYYRTHVQTYGWLDWAKNGESAGSEGCSKRVEAIQIVLVPKGGKAPGSTQTPYRVKLNIAYTSHVQTYGWQDWVYNGGTSGTSGKSKRLEGIKIRLDNPTSLSAGVEYQTHVQTYGWENTWKKNGELSGTSGKSKRLEAIRIRLTGEMASKYDVYYRVHAQTYGWLGWAKNGEEAGTEGYSKRLEAIEIVLVLKGQAAPGSTANRYIKRG
ncbi:MAG: CHAP domain-containing protein [Lachnospiraceae bacterium]|nr:CHAP domain-containing protein [Lachnospiraceae bacterium]